MIPIEQLRAGAAGMHISLTDAQLAQFDRYAELLVAWNQKMNLTGITDPSGIVIRHFLDSLSVLACAPISTGASLIDVGTGAGFPGIPLKIARPDLRLTLLDSLNKRLTFLQTVMDALGLSAQIVHMRAEDGGRNPAMRAQYDVVTARAVAALPVLAEYCIPFAKKGGLFVAMKGPECEAECAASDRGIRILGGRIERTVPRTLDDGSGRTLVLIRKAAPTPPAYPRAGAKIAKSPLGALPKST